MALVILAVVLAVWFAWPGRMLAQRSKVAEALGIPMDRVQLATGLFPGLPVPGHAFRILGPDGHPVGEARTSRSGQLWKLYLGIGSGGLLARREPDPLLTAEGTDGLARELIERFWGSAPVPLERLGYSRSKHGSVEASWRTLGPEVRVYTLRGMPSGSVILERGEPQP
jgi:hypothetical protein